MGIMSLSEIMGRSIDILRKYFKSLVLFTLGYGVIITIGILIIIVAGVLVSIFAAGVFENTAFIITAASLLVLVVASLSLSFQAGIIKIAGQEVIGEKVDTYKAIGTSFKSIFKIMGLIIVCTLMLLPLAGAIIAVVAVFSAGFDRPLFFYRLFSTNEVLIVILAVLVVLLFYFAIMAYITWLCFTLQALVLENKGVIGSIKRSFKLVRKSYWRIMGCLILFYLTLYAVNMSFYSFIALVISIVFLVMKLLSIQPDYMTFISMALNYAQWPLNIISWIVISPIGTSMMTMLYFNQRFKKEGYDLKLRLNAIQKNNERKLTSEAIEHGDSPES